MDVFVQFLRNILCCTKDLNLFSGTPIHSPSHTALYYKFPPPLDETTPLEFFIGLTQFYAFVSVSLAGYNTILKGIRKLNLTRRLLQRDFGNNDGDKIVQESLLEEYQTSRKNVFVGFWIFVTGVSFFWLFGNSLHVTSTNWIGGLKGLIHALTVMEVALAFLLYDMFVNGMIKLKHSRRIKELSKQLLKSGGRISKIDNLVIDADIYNWIVHDGWRPFWKGSNDEDYRKDDIELEKLVNKEIEQVQMTLDALRNKPVGDANKNNDELVRAAAVKAFTRLNKLSERVRKEGYCDFVYFVVNCIAFYGYLLAVICYYYDFDDDQPNLIWYSKLGMKTTDADWHGNFAGDLMWSIEPMLIFGSPFWVHREERKEDRKVKEE